MSPESQRIAIAAACGTHTITLARRSWNPGVLPLDDVIIVTDKNGHQSCEWPNIPASSFHMEFVSPPDYPNDLNAMHKAEKILNEAQLDSYAQLLYTFVARDNEVRRYGIHATAAQRAEAFLRTIGKWTT